MRYMHKFLVEAASNVASVSFNAYERGLLKEKEAKEYASKNMMLNIQAIFGATINSIESH